jgi:hypothetical protein
VRRSTEYYQSEKGREKKKAINRRRHLRSSAAIVPAPIEMSKQDLAIPGLSSQERYYRWLIRIIDGIRLGPVALRCVVERALAKVRQRSHEKYGRTRKMPDD